MAPDHHGARSRAKLKLPIKKWSTSDDMPTRRAHPRMTAMTGSLSLFAFHLFALAIKTKQQAATTDIVRWAALTSCQDNHAGPTMVAMVTRARWVFVVGPEEQQWRTPVRYAAFGKNVKIKNGVLIYFWMAIGKGIGNI